MLNTLLLSYPFFFMVQCSHTFIGLKLHIFEEAQLLNDKPCSPVRTNRAFIKDEKQTGPLVDLFSNLIHIQTDQNKNENKKVGRTVFSPDFLL